MDATTARAARAFLRLENIMVCSLNDVKWRFQASVDEMAVSDLLKFKIVCQ